MPQHIKEVRSKTKGGEEEISRIKGEATNGLSQKRERTSEKVQESTINNTFFWLFLSVSLFLFKQNKVVAIIFFFFSTASRSLR